MVLDIPYLLFSGCGTLMCYTDMKMSLRVELELGRQKKKLRKKLNVTPKRHDRDFRGVWGGGTGEVLSMPLRQDRCHKAN